MQEQAYNYKYVAATLANHLWSKLFHAHKILCGFITLHNPLTVDLFHKCGSMRDDCIQLILATPIGVVISCEEFY